MFRKLGNRKREKLANTTTLANETIIKKEGKDESGESRKFGKNRKSNKNVSLEQEKHAFKYRKEEMLKKNASRFRVDGPKRTFSNTMMSYILYY